MKFTGLTGIVITVGVLACHAPHLRAQTSTADGVDAFARGDYQRAVDILKPIAEAPGSTDEAAQFFMAMMYQSALGVSGDVVRACALYQATSQRHGVFARQAADLNDALRSSMRQEEFLDCVLISREGFNPTFQPATFTLEPGQWITLTLRGATISYQGMEKHFNLVIPSPGIVFLPVEHTELKAGGTGSTRRHFIELFMWVPASNMQKWTLRWHVWEIVRNDAVQIAATELTTISAAQPPAGASTDLHAMAVVRVDDAGNAEWAVMAGPKQGSRGVIESDADRQEKLQQKSAREAADARVDWTRVRDPRRTPSLAYPEGDGCGNAFLFGWSDDRTEAITVRADKDRLQLSLTPRTFDLASQKTDLEVVVHVFERPRRSESFCTDIGAGERVVETWRAVGGLVTIEASPPGIRPGQPSLYRATVHIVGAEFVSATGVRVRQARPITLTGIVGSPNG